MNTRKILLSSSDRELIKFVEISALTLTKLNCQVTIAVSNNHESIIQKAMAINIDLIIIDFENLNSKSIRLIEDLRKNESSKSKKVISIYSNDIDKEEVHAAGCDSIMSKDELKKNINNILQF